MNQPHGYTNTASPSVDDQIARQARRQIATSHLGRWSDQLEIACQDGAVMLTGQLPSFYLKQILQTIIRKVPGVREIENHVLVTSTPAGTDRHRGAD